jgi:hypothetical protein
MIAIVTRARMVIARLRRNDLDGNRQNTRCITKGKIFQSGSRARLSVFRVYV